MLAHRRGAARLPHATSSTRTSIRRAADVAALSRARAFDDVDALERFGAAVDVATYEFENLPVAPLEALGDKLQPGHPLARHRPGPRERRKRSSSDAARGSRRGARSSSLADVDAAVAELGAPLVLKTRRYGYDGKGQAWIRSRRDAAVRLGLRSAKSRRSPKPASTSPPNSR